MQNIPRETLERLLGLLVFVKDECLAVNSASYPAMRMALMSENLARTLKELYGRGGVYNEDVKALRQALGYETVVILCKSADGYETVEILCKSADADPS